MMELKDRNVVVMGLGRFGGGVGAARYCAERGAQVLVTDLEGEDALRRSIEALSGVPVAYRLGGHSESDFSDADMVVVNPAVDPRKNQYLQAARRSGAALTCEINLVIDQVHRERVIGVTGTAGKSTTTAMIGHVLQETLGKDRVHVGGNIGGSLLGSIDAIGDDDWVVLEISSFMLEMIEDWSPGIAVVTNLSDNHLDRHETMAEYAEAKQKLIRHQREGDAAIIHESLSDWESLTRGEVRIIGDGFEGDLLVPGVHNRLNAEMAKAVGEVVGIDGSEIARGLASFGGLAHRLQLVAEHNGVRFFNDSKCTTPSAAMLAIDAFERGCVHVILGGYDKEANLAELSTHAATHCGGVYTIGATGGDLVEIAQNVKERCEIHDCGDLETAVRQACMRVKKKDVVLLSPGCASWDQFSNYEERGRKFGEYVLRYTNRE